MPRQYARALYAVYAVFTIGIVGVVYATAGKEIIAMGTGDGSSTGFLSDVISNLDSLMPILLSALVLFTVLWFIVSPAQEERTVNRRQRRRR